MKRRTFDIILTWVGALLVVVLLIAGGLLVWGYSFTNTNVHNQLAAQQIYFPQAGSAQLANPEIGPYLNQYAGQQLTTGAQAAAYANHFIAVHIKEMSGGKTYAQLSAESLANPSDTQLHTLVETVFRGTTLRGLLLEAYAFSMIGTIALIAGIVSFATAFLMMILVALGYRHARKTPPDAEVLATSTAPTSEKELVGAH